MKREFAGDAGHERFGPTLAAEASAEEYGLTVHHETLRRWMLAAGLWSRVRDAPKHRQRRERKAHFGELVQLDGSFEASLEDRGPTACLMHMVDDATSRAAGRFEPQETIWAPSARYAAGSPPTAFRWRTIPIGRMSMSASPPRPSSPRARRR